jgi:hypothetical protein
MLHDRNDGYLAASINSDQLAAQTNVTRKQDAGTQIRR